MRRIADPETANLPWTENAKDNPCGVKSLRAASKQRHRADSWLIAASFKSAVRRTISLATNLPVAGGQMWTRT